MTINVNDLPQKLMELRHRLHAGEDVLLADGGEPFATIVSHRHVPPADPPQRIGFAKGSFFWMAPDFDDPLPDEFWFGGEP